MSEEAAFLAALRANPADDTTRLVYADWLDEHGEAAKAEYLRLVAAVAHAGGDLTDRPEGGALAALAPALTDDWRFATGSRFVATLFGYAHGAKINAIKHIREAIGGGLGEAKAMSEQLPHRLRDGLMFDRAREIALHVRQAPGAVVAVLPTELEALPFAVTYDIVAEYHVWSQPEDRARLVRIARAALADFLVRATGASAADAAKSAESELVVLERGLSIDEANDRVSALSRHLTSIRRSAYWSVNVCTRHVATAIE
ncbi:MAG: ribosomal protein L7/L12 [Planctomycetes bacterium]|nr:ribosomal protein L7/L12 [Planctomycetota bacterium]